MPLHMLRITLKNNNGGQQSTTAKRLLIFNDIVAILGKCQSRRSYVALKSENPRRSKLISLSFSFCDKKTRKPAQLC